MIETSVIIPVYNRPEKIVRAIQSVLNQTYQDFELIIIDDNSTDNTREIIQSLGIDRLKLYVTAENSGAAAARNLGIEKSRGSFIALIDSDDVMHSSHLEISISKLKQHAEQEFSYTGVGDIQMMAGEQLVAQEVWQISKKHIEKERPYLYDLHFGTSAGIVFKKSIFQKIGIFDANLRAAEDTDFFIRASEYSLGLPVNYCLIYKDHQSEDRLTSNYTANAEAYDSIISKHEEEISSNRFLILKWLYKAIWLNFYAGKKRRSFYYLRRMLAYKVFDAKTLLITIVGTLLPATKFISFHKYISSKRFN